MSAAAGATEGGCELCQAKGLAMCQCSNVVEFPTGHIHYDTPATVEREAIVKYLKWAAETEVGTVLSPEQREGIAYAAAWIDNRLDQMPELGQGRP